MSRLRRPKFLGAAATAVLLVPVAVAFSHTAGPGHPVPAHCRKWQITSQKGIHFTHRCNVTRKKTVTHTRTHTVHLTGGTTNTVTSRTTSTGKSSTVTTTSGTSTVLTTTTGSPTTSVKTVSGESTETDTVTETTSSTFTVTLITSI